MEIRAPIVFQAVLKSFSDVLLPAIDPANSLAQEQGRLVLGLLTLLAHRLPLEQHYDRDELQRLTALGHELQALAADPALGDALAATTAPSDVVAAIASLRAAIGDRVAILAARPDAIGRDASRLVLAAARAQQLRERSWLLMQGWEIDPATVPPIESLIPGLKDQS